MAVTASGVIAMSGDVVGEFTGAAPHSLSEYYRNGIYINSGNTNVPTSGEISMSDFYGAAANVTVTVTEGSIAINGVPAGSTSYYGYGATNKYIDADTFVFRAGGARGARTPTSLNGATIQGLYRILGNIYDPGTFFTVVLSGTRAKSFFTSISVLGIGTFTSASAAFSTVGGSSTWKFSTATVGGWDGSGTRTVTFT